MITSLVANDRRPTRLTSRFAGTGRLVRLALRRDRVLLPVWLVSLAGLTGAVVASVVALYTTEQERVTAAAFTASSVVARVFDGPASGTDIGAMAMVEAFGVIAILVALMSQQTVVRHTRQEEETGRAELVGSAVVGRHAPLTAALVVAIGANLVVAALVGALLIANDLPAAGAMASGAALGAVGATFAAVAAVTAQLSAHQRSANGWATAVLGVAFLLRAVGDAAGTVAANGVELVSGWPSWLSPIGWGQQVRPFHHNAWWVFALFAALVAVLVAVAFLLTNHRDVGSGMVATRPGPAVASRRLLSPLGLAWRQQRGVLLGWMTGLTLVAIAFGAVGDGADELITTNEQLEALLATFGEGVDMVDAFFAFMIALLGVAATGYTVQGLLRARGEESVGRLEPVLATSVSRQRWLLSHVGIVAGGTTAILVLVGLGTGLGYGVATGDPFRQVAATLAAGLVQVPAALAIGGVVVVAFAVVPPWAVAVAWGALVVSLVIGQFGDLLDLPQAITNLSPFTHLPAVPAADVTLLPITMLVAASVVLVAAGTAWFARRDIATT